MRILVVLLAAALFAASPVEVLRGKLAGGALVTADNKRVALAGDADTKGVLNDKRLAGAEVELRGRFTAPGVFTLDPIHTKAMHVHRQGKRFTVSYWCEVCAIRTYTPGQCWCCQEDTELDLQVPEKE
ncbi:MAG: hypothetical protein ACRD96_23780 [Bryobacteraceae bacterium]